MRGSIKNPQGRRKNHPQPQNRKKKIRSEPKPTCKTVQMFISQFSKPLSIRYGFDKWNIQKFRGYSRSVEAHNGRLDRRENGIQIAQSENFIGIQIRSPLDRYFRRKPNAKERKIRKLQGTPNPKNRNSLAQKPILKKYGKSQ